MTSSTQSNLSAILSHCGRGEEMIVGNVYHTALDEAAGASVLGGVAISTIEVEDCLSIKRDLLRMLLNLTTLIINFKTTLFREHLSRQSHIENLKNHAEAKEMDLSIHLDGANYLMLLKT